MEDTEVLMNEGGIVSVLQDYIPRRLEGLARHRVLRWLNCNIFSLHFKVPNTTKFLESPDDSFNRFLKAFFLITLSLGLLRIILETGIINILLIAYNSSTICTIFVVAAIVVAVIVVAVIVVAVIMAVTVKQKMDFTKARKEEVKTISGLIQQV